MAPFVWRRRKIFGFEIRRLAACGGCRGIWLVRCQGTRKKPRAKADELLLPREGLPLDEPPLKTARARKQRSDDGPEYSDSSTSTRDENRATPVESCGKIHRKDSSASQKSTTVANPQEVHHRSVKCKRSGLPGSRGGKWAEETSGEDGGKGKKKMGRGVGAIVWE